MIQKYQKPDLTRPMEEIREEIRIDYVSMAQVLALPPDMSFDALRDIVYAGMTSNLSYPFKKFQERFYAVANERGIQNEDLMRYLDIVIAVWNNFPHRDLGMSPNEKFRETRDMGGGVSINEVTGEPQIDEKVYHALIAHHIRYLSDQAFGMAGMYLKRLGATSGEIDAVLQPLTDPDSDPGQSVTNLLTLSVKWAKERAKRKKGEKLTMADIQPSVRAVAFCENHGALVMQDGVHSSHMFQDVVRQVMEYNEISLRQAEKTKAPSARILDPLFVLRSLVQTHDQIEEQAQKISAPEILAASAHHVLDWIMYADVRDILERDPDETALLTLGAAWLVSKTGYPEGDLGVALDTIHAALGTAMDRHLFDLEIRRLAEKALMTCSDPMLMIADLVNSPDDVDDALRALAPNLPHRSPVSPDDLPRPLL